MKATCLAVAFLVLIPVSRAAGAGLAFNGNFSVMAPDQVTAEEVLSGADALREELALEWLGGELPPGIGRTGIHVKLSDTEDWGLIWFKDHPNRTLHRIWLRTSRDSAMGSSLAHEMTHLVLHLGTRGALPTWADEGAASLRDDPQRTAIRNRTMASIARDGNWPDLAQVFELQRISGSSQTTYSVVSSVTEYLLTRGDKRLFIRFALDGKDEDWDQSMRKHYGMSMAEFQADWRAWVARNTRRTSPSPVRTTSVASVAD